MTDRIKIGTKIYEAKAITDLSILQLLELETELERFGRPMTVPEIRKIGNEIAALSEDEWADHPQALLMMGIGIWAARRAAGETVTFAEAINFPMSDFSALPATTDRPPPANPTRARTVSARAKKPATPRKPRSS